MDLERAFQLVINPGSCVFDIGSFKGEVAGKLALLTGGQGMVCAFEPHPIHYFELSGFSAAVAGQHNLKIFPYCKAMSDSVGHTVLHISQFVASPDYNQASSVLPELANESRLGQGMLRLRVETDTLDSFCRNTFYFPSFMKIDTEGADARVIKGGAQMIERCRPAIISEWGYDPRQPLPTNCVEHLKLLEGLGYDIFLVDVMSFKEQWTKPDSPLNSDYVFRFGSADAAMLPGVILGNLLALPRNSPAYDNSPVRKQVAPISALQFLGK